MCETIDSSSGVVFPFYDNDTNMVFLAGKVRMYGMRDELFKTQYVVAFYRAMVIFGITKSLTKHLGCIISVNLYREILREGWG